MRENLKPKASSKRDSCDVVVLSLRGASARISLIGGRVLSWETRDGYEVLYRPSADSGNGRSERRGGIPVCFPQFSGLGPLPKHGFVQDMRWAIEDVVHRMNSTTARLRCLSDERTHGIWPFSFEVVLSVRLRPSALLIHLAARLGGLESAPVTLGLHTYFRTPGLRPSIHGLEGQDFVQSLSQPGRLFDCSSALLTREQIDRIYSPSSVTLRSSGPPLRVLQTGFDSTVIWNPGPIVCGEISDLAEDAWKDFVCIEPASVQPLQNLSGKWWTGAQLIRVQE